MDNYEELTQRIFHTIARGSFLAESMYKCLNLTHPQVMVLYTLESHGTMPIGKIADEIHSARSSTTGIVERLEAMALVRRIQDQDDRRVVMVELCDTYRAKKQQTLGALYSTTLQERLAALSAEQQDELMRSLELLEMVLK